MDAMQQLPLFDNESTEASFTELATFLRCPLEYKLRFIDEKESAVPRSPQVLWGRRLHSIAHQYLDLPIDQRSLDFLIERLDDNPNSSSLPDGEYHLSIFRNTMRYFHDIFAQAEVYRSESAFTAPLGHFVLTGRPDAIVYGQRGLTLFEFKYSDYREFDYQSDIDHHLQLIFYSLGLRAIHVNVAEASYYFFDSGKTDSIALSESFMDRGAARIAEILDRISTTDDFTPRANRLCPSCGSRKGCHLQTQRRSER